MSTIQFENGAKVRFDGTPTPADIEEVSAKLKATQGIDQFANYGPVEKQPEKKRSTLGKVAEFLAPALTRTVGKAFDPNQDVTARDIIGSGLEIASYALPVGAAAKGVTLAARGLGLAAKPLKQGI